MSLQSKENLLYAKRFKKYSISNESVSSQITKICIKIQCENKLSSAFQSSMKRKQMNVASVTLVQMRRQFIQFVFKPQVHLQQDGAQPQWGTIV